MTIENANDHPFKVAIVKDAEMFANSHPFKVYVEGGGGGGAEGRVVDELPEEGEPGYIYLVLKEETKEGDIYDEWIWALQQDGETYGWEHLGATNEVVLEIDDAMSDTSENAVQNKVIKAYVDALGGGIKTLTADDYNSTYGSTRCFSPVAAEPGIYKLPSGLKYRMSSTDDPIRENVRTSSGDIYYVVVDDADNRFRSAFCLDLLDTTSGADGSNYLVVMRGYRNTGSFNVYKRVALSGDLKDLKKLIKSGSGAPTTSTTGQKGTIYEDTTTGKIYVCVAISGSTYTWEELGSGGGGSSTIIGHGMPKSTTEAEQGQFYLDTDGNDLYLCDAVAEGTATWSLVPKEEVKNYAEITYYPNWEKVVYTKETYECELTNYDVDKWSEWSSQHPLDEWMAEQGYQFNYSDGSWEFNSMEEPVTIPEDEMYDTTGLGLSAETNGAWCYIDMSVNVDKTTTATTSVRTSEQFEKLCFEGKDAVVGPFGEEGVMILQSAIQGVKIFNENLSEIPDNFLQNCYNLEDFYTTAGGTVQQYELQFDGVTKIGNNFLRGCHRIRGRYSYDTYTSAISIHFETVEIGDYFLSDIGDTNNEIPRNFDAILMYFATTGSASVNVGNSFLRNVRNQAWLYITSADGAFKSVGDYFCSSSQFTKVSFQTIMPKTLGSYFLSGCAYLTTITDGSISSAFSKVEVVGDRAFSGCSVLNCPISLPRLRKAGNNFLSYAYVFNSALSIPLVEEIGAYFMYQSRQFNQPLTFYNLQLIDNMFMSGCRNYYSTIIFGQKYIFIQAANPASILSCSSTSDPMYATGVTIKGEGRSTILALGNRTSSPYRKLIDGGE